MSLKIVCIELTHNSVEIIHRSISIAKGSLFGSFRTKVLRLVQNSVKLCLNLSGTSF